MQQWRKEIAHGRRVIFILGKAHFQPASEKTLLKNSYLQGSHGSGLPEHKNPPLGGNALMFALRPLSGGLCIPRKGTEAVGGNGPLRLASGHAGVGLCVSHQQGQCQVRGSRRSASGQERTPCPDTGRSELLLSPKQGVAPDWDVWGT